MTPQAAQKAASKTAGSGPAHFTEVVYINDYPQHARWKVTHKETYDSIIDLTGCAITAKGQFFSEKQRPGPGEEKLHLVIEGTSDIQVHKQGAGGGRAVGAKN